MAERIGIADFGGQYPDLIRRTNAQTPYRTAMEEIAEHTDLIRLRSKFRE